MKILQFTKKFPFPLYDGESIAIQTLSKGLVEAGAEVHLFALNTSKHYYSFQKEKCPGALSHYTSVHAVDIHTSINWFKGLLNLLSSRSYLWSRFYKRRVRNELKKYLSHSEFDIILLETSYLLSYVDDLDSNSNGLLCLRAHNVEYEIWERQAATESSPIKRIILNLFTSNLKSFELAGLKKVDGVITVSQRDLDMLVKNSDLRAFSHVCPIGLDQEKYNSQAYVPHSVLRLGFIGSLDWRPNLTGITWFLKRVLPRLQRLYPGKYIIHIAGRHIPARLEDFASQSVVIMGEVADSIKFLNQVDVLLVPLFAGSGTRVKIIEALSLGKVVLSTPLGSEGIGVSDQENILLAKDADEFVSYIGDLCKNPSLIHGIGRKARFFAKEEFDYKEGSRRLYNKFKEWMIQTRGE